MSFALDLNPRYVVHRNPVLAASWEVSCGESEENGYWLETLPEGGGDGWVTGWSSLS